MSKKITDDDPHRREEKILQCVYSKSTEFPEGIGRNNIRNWTGIPPETVTKILLNLEERELVKIKKQPQGGKWSIRPAEFSIREDETKLLYDNILSESSIKDIAKDSRIAIKNSMAHLLYGLSLSQVRLYWDFLQGNETPYLIADQMIRKKLRAFKPIISDKFFKKGKIKDGSKDLRWIEQDIGVATTFLIEKAGFFLGTANHIKGRLRNAGETIYAFDVPVIHEDWINGLLKKYQFDKMSKTKKKWLGYEYKKMENSVAKKYTDAQKNLAFLFSTSLWLDNEISDELEKMSDAEIDQVLMLGKSSDSLAVMGDSNFQNASISQIRKLIKELKKLKHEKASGKELEFF